MINENYNNNNNFNSDEKILYEIVEIILKSQDKIDLLKNDLKIIKEKNIQKSNKKTFDLKFNITKNLSKINELSNELNYKKKFLEEIQINTKNQIENLDLEYKKIKDKLNNLNLNKKELDEDEIEKLINLKKDNENLKSFSIEYSNVENQINNYKNKIKENENNYFLIENNLNMLKEEKKTIKFNIINLISEKESLEEIINNFFGQKINKKNFFYYLNNNIEFYVYELKNLDMNLLCNELAVNLINFMIYNNLIMNFDTEDINLKYDLSNFLKNEILNFLNNKKELLTFFYFNNFIENLSKKIISTFELNYDSNKLANFLLYVIKLNYLNKVIDFNLKFIENYKNLKKNYLSKSEEIINENKKLKNKIEENNIKLKSTIEKKDLYLQNNNIKNINSINLSNDEINYLNLNDKLKQINKEKNELNEDLKNKINSFNILNNNLNNKIKDLQNENILYQNQIDYYEKEDDEKSIEIKKEIELLNNVIKENFQLIKNQLNLNKKKYGNKLNFYNKLVSNINKSLDRFSKTNFLFNLNNNSFYDLNTNSSFVNVNLLSPYNSPQKYENSQKKFYSEKKPIHYRNIFNLKNNNNNIKYDQFYTVQNTNFYINSEIKKENNNYNIKTLNNENNHNNKNNNILIESFSSNLSKNTNYLSNNQNLISLNKKPIKSRNISDNRISYKIQYKKNNNLFNLNENQFTSNKDLESTIRTTMEKNNKNNKFKINNKIIDYKYKLLNLTFCYYRKIESLDTKFDPLFHSNNIINFNFEKVYIKLNDNYTNLLILKNNKILLNKIPLKNIECTIINNNIQYIIKIYQRYKQLLKEKNKIDLDSFVKSEEFKNIPLDYNKRAKAAKNKYFNFFILINNYNKKNNNNEKYRLEFVFNSYENIKLWLNGINFIVKKNKKLI